jgi:hypothetical protein
MEAGSGNAAEIKIDSMSIRTSSKSIRLSVVGNTGNYTVFGDWLGNGAPTGQSWELSMDVVLNSYNSFSTLFGKLGTNVAISVYPQGNTSGKKYYTGNAVLAGLGNDMPADDLSISVSLKGNGALTESTVSPLR